MSITLELISQAAASDRGEGVIDWLTGLLTDIQNLERLAVYVLGIAFFIWQGWISKGAMARVIMAGIAAAVFIYFGHNMTDVSDRVDNEVNAGATALYADPLLA